MTEHRDATAARRSVNSGTDSRSTEPNEQRAEILCSSQTGINNKRLKQVSTGKREAHYYIQAAQHLCDGLNGNGEETHHYLEVRRSLLRSLPPPPRLPVYKLKG